MPKTVKQIVDCQRCIETEADKIVRRLRLDIAELRKQMLIAGDESFQHLLDTTLARLSTLLNVTDASASKTVIALTETLEQISEQAAETAALKFRTHSPVTGKQVFTATTVQTVKKEMQRLKASKLSNMQIINTVIGSKSQKYKNGLLNVALIHFHSKTRTEGRGSVETAAETKRRNTPDVIGYLWVSILDFRTSSGCQALSNRRFYYNRSGVKPKPGYHPNCRSSTESIIKGEPVPEIESFAEWAKDPDNQDELLESMGPTRYKLFTEGKLNVQRFRNSAFKPLSIEQLKTQLSDKNLRLIGE